MRTDLAAALNPTDIMKTQPEIDMLQLFTTKHKERAKWLAIENL